MDEVETTREGSKGEDISKNQSQEALPHRKLEPWPRRNVLLQQWTKELLKELNHHIVETARNGRSASAAGYRVRRILIHAETNGLTDRAQITAPWLAAMTPLMRGARWDRESRTLLGRLFVKTGIWTKADFDLLRMNLAATRKKTGRRTQVDFEPNPPKSICKLAWRLAFSCGLSTGQMQSLRVDDEEPDGLRLRSGGLIRFGNGWHQVPKDFLVEYLKAENPVANLFFARSPRDKRKPISRQSLEAAVATLYDGETPLSLRKKHFREDFHRARDLRELRFHFRNFHDLSNIHVHQLICGKRSSEQAGFVAKASSFPVPEPYLLVAICASGVLPGAVSLRPGAPERSFCKWSTLLGRYSVTVDWPTSHLKELSGRGRKAERALRSLIRVAWLQWYEGRRLKPSRIQKRKDEDQDLQGPFAKTFVEVTQAQTGHTWSGALFEFRNRKRTCYCPLIETMNGAAWRNQCHVCMHPDRLAVDREIRTALETEGRVKGLKAIAKARGLSYSSLMRHAGKAEPVPHRGETSRSHLGAPSATAVVRVPKSLLGKLKGLSSDSLIVFVRILLQKQVSNETVALDRLEIHDSPGFSFDDHRLSVALSALRFNGLIRDFGRLPRGFSVSFDGVK